MSRRRRKRKKWGKGAAVICTLAVLCLGGAAVVRILPNVIDEARETFQSAVPQQAEFPELTVTEEEVAGSFYFDCLTEEEQTVYRELLQGVNGMEETIRLHAGDSMDTAKVYEYLLYDRPELFWCDGSSRMTVYADYTEFSPGYTCSRETRDSRQTEIDSAAEQCLAGMPADSSEYERIRYVYEYLVDTVDYDQEAPDDQNIYSALVGKRSVCAGYSRAAQYLLGKTGIRCIYVTGTVSGQSAHAWNIVSCGGNWYQMDVTFGDPVFLEEESGEHLSAGSINYDYLCCTDEEIMIDHVQDDFVEYPPCVSDDLNYYKMNGMYYDDYDPQTLLQAMNQSIYAGEDSFVCKFPEGEAYSRAREGVIQDLLPRAAQNLASHYGLSSVRYTYSPDDSHCKITVFWDYGEG